MRKLYTAFLLVLSALLGQYQASSQVVISQVYGGGGNSGAFYKNDFIELFNRGTEPVNINGWSVQYASAAGTSWQVTSLTGVLQPGQYYLVQEAAGANPDAADLPTADAVGAINMSGTAGKVALVANSTPLTIACPTSDAYVDFVGFGTTANCFEGGGRTPAPSNANAVFRGGNGCDDTDNNNNDFTAAPAAPRNTATTLAPCTAVPPTPLINVAPGNNGAEPGTNGSFIISATTAIPPGGIMVFYTLSGTAQAGSDYTDMYNGIVPLNGGSSTIITISVVDDNLFEPTETVQITLTSVSPGFSLGATTATINIFDDDVPEALPLVTTYNQNFNILPVTGTNQTWENNLTIPGWYSSRTAINAGNGSSNTGALYSFGENGSTDRALGSIGSGSTGTVYYGVRFQNNTGGPIHALRIEYKGEQWRNGGNATPHTAGFAYQTGGTITSLTDGVWTAVPELGFTGPVATTTAAALNGNELGTNATMVAYTITGLNIPAGDEIFIRWDDPDHSGSDHGLAIDDFFIEANPVDEDPPAITALSPNNNATNIATNTSLSISFNETIQKGSGEIRLRLVADNSVVQSWDINSSSVQLSGNQISWTASALAVNTAFYVEWDEGVVKDMSGNNLPATSGASVWTFTTGTTFFLADFNNCGTNLSDGFTQYSAVGDVVWACTPFGRDPNEPAGTAAYPTGVQINGFANGTNTPNVDWLISPSFDLTGTTYPLLSFWSRVAFNGAPLQLKVSTDYNGGDPASATWHDLNGRFPQIGSNIWTLSENINLSAYKASNVHIAWVYTSSDEDGARWTLDDVSLANSPVPPPPSLTISTSDINFAYVAAGSSGTRSFVLTGNDLTDGFTLTSTTNFMLSKNGSEYGPSIQYSLGEANNQPLQVWVAFAPAQQNQNFTGKITITGSGLEDSVSLQGTTIDPLTTLEVVNWNIEWFGSPGNGPVNDAQQEQNVRTILQNINADVYALVEIVDEARLASVVSQMPGYAYVISDFGSHTNPYSSSSSTLGEAQKLAFIYKTSVLSDITADPLLSIGINSPEDAASANYNYWSSGRYPYMLTANVSLNCATTRVRFVLVHAKANTSPTATSYDRRKNGADALYAKLNADYPDDRIIILGDFNDDLDQSITAGFTTTSWDSFVNDTENFSAITLPLSLAGKKSTVAYNDIIDHVVISNELVPYYMPGTATVLNDVTSLVSNYGNSTSDHYPVFSRFMIPNSNPPFISNCQPEIALCYRADGQYELPVLLATDDCSESVSYSYVISGATQRSGSTNNASGNFEPGTSTIVWTVSDSWGNISTCTTSVTVAPVPIVTIPDAYALPSGTSANTVYIGYAPASSLTLEANVAGGNSSYSFSWSTGSLSNSVTVSPITNTNYTVSVTDANGCVGTASKQVIVKDIRAGNNNNKVVICKLAGKKYQTLEVAAPAVPAHLANGGYLGACEDASAPAAARLDVAAQPNPSSSQFTIRLNGGESGKPVSLKVMNLYGQVIEQKQGLVPGQTVTLGANYHNGTYFVEVIQGGQRVTVTVIKI
ncbi:MAG: Ig-like domain-containing protein [Chitinophagaceae bacterium]|nr:Ig-like domain-containing protein [Chitinophagaceae bacterium]